MDQVVRKLVKFNPGFDETLTWIPYLEINPVLPNASIEVHSSGTKLCNSWLLKFTFEQPSTDC